MKLNAIRFGIAWAVAAAVLWVLCSLIVLALPGPSMMMSRNMMHSDMGHWTWSLSPAGLAAGLVLWSVSAGLFGWLTAVIYNALARSEAGRDT